MYFRYHVSILKERISEKRKFIQVLLGPRQTGKTTIVKQLLKDYRGIYQFATADEALNGNAIWIEQQWQIARAKLKNEDVNEVLLIIDEIQKIDNWSSVVKKEWDEDSFKDINIKVVLLGSAQLLLQKGLSESLAGRFEVLKVYHWCYNEMQEAFGFSPEQYVWFGAYPGSVDLVGNEKRWKDYIINAIVNTTVNQDILMMTRIDKPALMRQVFDLGCLYSGQVLSYNKMLGQLQDAGNTTTIAHYAELLSNAGLIASLNKIYSEPVRQKNSIPKWQVYNNALFSALVKDSYKDRLYNPGKWGRHVESAIGVNLINQAQEKDFEVYYWKHKDEEVDFVLKKGDAIVALEVKSGKAKKTKGMGRFAEIFKTDKIYLVGSSGMSWEDFLRMDANSFF